MDLTSINEIIKESVEPKHYDTKIQAIDYIEANELDFAEGNIIKYITRYKKKNGLEDLLKAKFYVELLINRYKKK